VLRHAAERRVEHRAPTEGNANPPHLTDFDGNKNAPAAQPSAGNRPRASSGHHNDQRDEKVGLSQRKNPTASHSVLHSRNCLTQRSSEDLRSSHGQSCALRNAARETDDYHPFWNPRSKSKQSKKSPAVDNLRAAHSMQCKDHPLKKSRHHVLELPTSGERLAVGVYSTGN
jgi:hypothetical protein